MAVVSLSHRRFKVVDKILLPSPPMVREKAYVVEGRVSVAPNLHPLDRAETSHIAVIVSPSVCVGPDYIDVKPVDQISSSYIPLELDGALNRGELVLDLHIIIKKHSLRRFIPHPLRPLECQIQLQLPRISEAPMLRMKGVGVSIGRRIGWNCLQFSQS